MGNGLLLGFGHLLEEGVWTSIIAQPLGEARAVCTLAAQKRPLANGCFRRFAPAST
jgi:hypothetical protein